MLVVTGASDNHFFTLLNMVRSFIHSNQTNHLIVYNLGLSDDKWSHIQHLFNYPSISFKVFDYSNYPSWFNIHIEAGQYAWKPTIIYNTFLEHPDEKIVWMDAGNIIYHLTELDLFLDTYDVYSGTSGGTIEKWTVPETLTFMNCTWVDRENRNAACIGFNGKKEKVKKFIKEFHDLAQIKECIAPEGSSRENHRQDQAVFTILFYKYGFMHPWDHHIGYSIHNDID